LESSVVVKIIEVALDFYVAFENPIVEGELVLLAELF
jgi:hypothetical protein